MTPQKFVNDLLSTAYNEEYMACHSLGGTSSKESRKSGLPAEDVLNLLVDLHFVLTYYMYMKDHSLTEEWLVGHHEEHLASRY